MRHIGKGVEVNEDTLAFADIEEVGPQGTYLVSDNTLEYFRDVLYMPTLSDRKTYEHWKADGALSAEQRANRKWKEILEQYGESTLDNETDASLRKFMENL